MHVTRQLQKIDFFQKFIIMIFMESILIKDTTKEQREKIVAEALGDSYESGCGYESTSIDYQLYIDGKKELRELNMEANCGFEVSSPKDTGHFSCMKDF